MTRTVVFDLDGVLYLAEEEVPGAGAVLRALTDAGVRVLFCTNNATRTRVQAAEKIERVTGFPADPETIFTSAVAAASIVSRADEPVFVVGEEGISEALDARGIAETQDHRASRTVVAGLDRYLTYERLAHAGLAIRRGARFVGTNGDVTFPRPDGLYPGAGSILAAIAAASGTEPELAGKPHAPMRRLIGTKAVGDVWMVGDRPDTDLAMATEEGWTSVLVLTGVVSDPAEASVRPDHVIESVATLPELVFAT